MQLSPSRRRALRTGFLLPAAVLFLWPSSSLRAAEPSSLQPTLDRIQRECLRAYPPELLARMASGVREIP